MKNILIAAAAALVLIVTGCQSTGHIPTLRPVVSEVQVPEISTTNIVWTTNIVQVPAKTDDSGNIVSPAREIEVAQPKFEITVVPAHTQTVTNGWEKDPAVYETAELVGSLYPGWGTLGAGAFGALGSILAAWQTRKTKQANQQAGANEAALVGTMQGIEQLRLALQQTPQGKQLDQQFVELLKKAQAESGSIDVIQKLLELHTGYTTQRLDINELLKDLSMDPKPV